MRRLTNLLFFLIKLSIPLLFLFVFSYQLLMIDVPDVSVLKKKHPTITSFMLEDKNTKNKITYTPLTQISPFVIKAVITSEDDLFFLHNGFNTQAIWQALKTNFKQKKLSYGASTITQQLARNLFLTRSKTILRKLREIFLTYRLEATLSKKRILELYLNTAEFGPGVYGIKNASWYHFKQKAINLNANQAAILAAVLPSPAKYAKKPYPAITYRRAKTIKSRMTKYDLHLPQDLFTN